MSAKREEEIASYRKNDPHMTRPKEEDKLENKSARETYQLNLSLADT